MNFHVTLESKSVSKSGMAVFPGTRKGVGDIGSMLGMKLDSMGVTGFTVVTDKITEFKGTRHFLPLMDLFTVVD